MFDYDRVYEGKNLKNALDILADNDKIVIINGGTDVLIKARENAYRNHSLLNISNINDKKDIIIKSGTTFSELESNEIVKKYLTLLACASSQVGSPQVRNVATIGGNICNGAVSADSVPSLFVLNAKLVLENSSGQRIVPIEEFYLGPGKTVLEKNELLKEIIISYEDYHNYFGVYKKFGRRKAMEIATTSCAVLLKLKDQGKAIEDYRIAYGVAAPTPVRCHKTEEKIRYSGIKKEMLDVIQNSVLEELYPRESWRASKELRQQVIQEFAVRATEEAINYGRRFIHA